MKYHQVLPRVSRLLILICFSGSWFAAVGVAGAQSSDDAHIVPRVSSARHTTTSDGPSAQSGLMKPIRVDVDLVLVPVAVTDTMNRPVVTLTKQDFSLYEENKRQQIRYFANEDAPVSIAVLFDVSKSMADKISTERAALAEFFKYANPADEYFGISFSDRPHFLDGPTQSIDELERKLISIEPSGPTAMLDAIYLAVSQLRQARYQRKAIIIFSDGGDNVSHYSLREIKSLAEECDTQIYAIGLFETFFFNTIEERLGKKWLGEITDKTGGRTLTVNDQAKLPQAAAAISREMRSEYVLGYRPAIADGKWRKIKVRVASATGDNQLQAHYKNGYFSAAR